MPEETVALDDRSVLDPYAVWGPYQEGRKPTNVDDAGGKWRRHALGAGDVRCETGYNSKNLAYTSFQRFYDTECKTTSMIFRLPTIFPINTTRFQVIAQWKQTGSRPDQTGYGDTPVLSLKAYKGRLVLQNTDYRDGDAGAYSQELWDGPAPLGVPIWFKLAVLFGVEHGAVSVNGEPAITDLCTIHPETPSHMRRGLYHDANIGPAYIDHGVCAITRQT